MTSLSRRPEVGGAIPEQPDCRTGQRGLISNFPKHYLNFYGFCLVAELSVISYIVWDHYYRNSTVLNGLRVLTKFISDTVFKTYEKGF